MKQTHTIPKNLGYVCVYFVITYSLCSQTDLYICIFSTLLWARIAALFANKASAIVLNRATGVVLVILGAAIMIVS